MQLPYLHQSMKHSDTRVSYQLNLELSLIDRYMASLLYQLTQAQLRILNEIKSDLSSGFIMNRLLQGDVGSGKTDLAILTLLVAIQSDMKGAFLVPTEVLAQQHFEKLSDRLTAFGVQVVLIKGK